MGWGTFLLSCAAMVATLFVPGYLALRCLRLGRLESLCVAPAITLAIMTILGVAYGRLGVGGTYYNMVAIPAAVLLVLCLLRRPWRNGAPAHGSHPKQDWLPVGVYLAVGITAMLVFFAGNLEGDLANFQPDNDNSFHLSLIRSIATSGDYSILSASVYRASSEAPFVGGGSFYPAGFHIIAASVVNLFGLSIPLAENALGAVTISFVWPLGIYWMLRHVFEKDRMALYAGALACMGIISFPWRFFTWGPLFPNLLSLALVPGAIGVFMEMFDAIRSGGKGKVLLQVFLFLVCLCSIAVAHPNGAFTLGVLLVPYMVSLIWHAPAGKHAAKAKGRRRVLCTLASLALLALVAGIWYVAYSLPALQSVVAFVWDPYEDFGSGILGALTLKTSGNRAQSLVAILLIVGLVRSLYDWRDHAWIFALFAFVSIQFAVSASVSGPVKQILCGFWYGDPNRLAANVGIAAVPVVALGASTVVRGLRKVFKATAPLGELASAGLSLVVFAALIGSSVLGHVSEMEKGFQLATTSSYDFSAMLEYKFSKRSPKGYDAAEQSFVDKVLEIVPEGELILNLPNDGSCFAYPVQGANVFYKDVTSPNITDAGQTEEARIIRRNLYRLSDYQSVQDAVRKLDAHYLLVLDQGLGTDNPNRILPWFRSSQWRGIMSVNDDTPGFEVVLAQDDMRLYRLVY